MDSLNVKNINDEKIFNVIDPNGQGDVANRIRPISISINQKAETINDETDSTISLSVYWNDTWKSILDLTFNESLRQEYGKLVEDLTKIQKDIDMKQYKDAETKTSDFLKYVANLSSKYTAIPETQNVAASKNEFITITAGRNNFKVKISDKLLNFMLRKFAKVDNLDYTKANECHSINRHSCIENNIDMYFHSPELFQKQAYMTIVKDHKVVGSYKVTYDQFCKLASKLALTPKQFGYTKDRLAGYMKTAEVVMQNIFFDSVDEAKEWQEMVDEKKKEQGEPTPEGEETETTETTETKKTIEDGKSESPIKEDGGLARPSEDFASDEIPESEPRQQEQQQGGQMAASRRLNLLKKRALKKRADFYNEWTQEEELDPKDVQMIRDRVEIEKGFGPSVYEKDELAMMDNILKVLKTPQDVYKLSNEEKKFIQDKMEVELVYARDGVYDDDQHEILKKVFKYFVPKDREDLKQFIKKQLEWFHYNFDIWKENHLKDLEGIVTEEEAKKIYDELVAEKNKVSKKTNNLNKKAEEQIPNEHIYEIIYLGFGQWQYIPTPLKPYIKQVMDILVEKGLAKVHDFGRGKGKYDSDLSIKEYVEKVKNIPEIMSIINKIYQKFGKKSFRLKSLNKKALYGDVQEQDIVPAKTETKVYLQSEKSEDFAWLLNGSGRIEILAPKDLILGATGSGDNSNGVNELRDYIKKDLEKIPTEEIQKTVAEYGTDNVKEMDRDELEKHLVWLLAGDTADDLENRLADKEDIKNVKAKATTKIKKSATDYKGEVAELLDEINEPDVLVDYISEDDAKKICKELNIPHEAEWYKGDLRGYIDEVPDGMVDVLIEYISESDAEHIWRQIQRDMGNDIDSSKKTKVKKQAEETIEEKIEQQVGEDGDVKATIGVGDIVCINFDTISEEDIAKYTDFLAQPMLLIETDKEDINKVIIEQVEYPFQRVTINKDNVCIFDEVKDGQVIVEDVDGDEMITDFVALPVVAKQCKIKSIHKAAKISKKKASVNSQEELAVLIDTILDDFDHYDYADQLEVGEHSLYENILADLQKDEKKVIEETLNFIAEDDSDEPFTSKELAELKEYYNKKYANGGK